MGIKEKLVKIDENIYEIPKDGKMLIPARIFISPKMLESLEDNAIQQVVNVAMLPGLERYFEKTKRGCRGSLPKNPFWRRSWKQIQYEQR